MSANGLESHNKWVKDINEYGAQFGPTDVQYPIVRLFTLSSAFANRVAYDVVVVDCR